MGTDPFVSVTSLVPVEVAAVAGAPKRVTVRLYGSTHGLLKGAAERQGVGLAVYLREAGLMRAAWETGLAHGVDRPGLEVFAEELERVRAALREQNHNAEGPT